MEKEQFLKKARIDLRFFFTKEFFLVFFVILTSSIISLISNVLWSLIFMLFAMSIIQTIKINSYKDFGLYKLLYYSKNSDLLLYLPIISSSIITLIIISNLSQSHLYNMFDVVHSETELFKMKDTAVSLILPFSLIVSISNYTTFDIRIKDLIDDKIYASDYYFKRIKDRYQSPRSLKELLINQSKTPNFWYLTERHEEDLVNDMFYRGYE